MKVKIYTEKEFERQLRKLSKKYRSMLDDYDAFLTGLEQDPFQGSSLGKGVRKVRMAIASKGKGKSGGARVILTDIVLESLERVCHKSMTHPLLVFIRIISNVLLVYPSKQGHQIGVPVDGNLVRSIAADVILVGFIWNIGSIGWYEFCIFLSLVGSSSHQTRYWLLDIVGCRDTVVDIHDPLGAEACQVAIACGVTSKEII